MAELNQKRVRRPKLSVAATLLTKKWKMAKPPELELDPPKFTDCVQRWSIHHALANGEHEENLTSQLLESDTLHRSKSEEMQRDENGFPLLVKSSSHVGHGHIHSPCKSSAGWVFCSVCFEALDPSTTEKPSNETQDDSKDSDFGDEMEIDNNFSNINNALDSIYFNNTAAAPSSPNNNRLPKSASESNVRPFKRNPHPRTLQSSRSGNDMVQLAPSQKLPSFDEFLKLTLK